MSLQEPLTESDAPKVGENEPLITGSSLPISAPETPAPEITNMIENNDITASPEAPQDGAEGAPSDQSSVASTSEPSLPPADYREIFVDRERLKALAKRLDEARDGVKLRINNPTLALSLFDNLEKAQQLILQGEEYYEESERLLSEVEYRLILTDRVVQASRKVGLPLFFYETAFFMLFAWALLRINMMPWYQSIREASPLAELNLVQLLSSLIWGGLGGVVGALYALWKHVAKDQDFDPQYALWYLTNPILGLMLGGFAFLVIQAGFFSLTAGAEAGASIRSAFVIYVLAWISGFKQNVVYEIVRRILDVFRVETPASAEVAGGTPKPGGAGTS